MRFKAKNGAIREKIAPIRANQITGTTRDFKMGVIKPKMSSEGESLVSKSGQIHEIERIKLKSMLNQKVIKFAGVSVLSMRVHCRGRRLGLRLMSTTRRDTVNFAFLYHKVSKVHNHVLEHHTVNVHSEYTPCIL